MLLAPLPACSDDAVNIYITAFKSGTLELDENQKASQDIILNTAPLVQLYVDVTNNYSNFFTVSYGNQTNSDIAMKFKPGDKSETVNIIGLKDTGGIKSILFTIRGTQQFQTLRVKVTKLFYPDSGPIPDFGPPDAAPGEGGASEGGAVDQSSVDTSTPTPDKGSSG